MDNKLKGDIGEQATILALLKAGLNVLKPVGDRLPYDLVVEFNNEFRRVQCKSRYEDSTGVVSLKLSNPTTSKVIYSKDNVDCFAIYSLTSDKLCFINIEEIKSVELRVRFAGACKSKKSLKTFYSDQCADPQRIFNPEIGSDFTPPKYKEVASSGGKRPERYKVVRPSKEELEELIWTHPTVQVAKMFGISDNGVNRRCKDLNISKPPRGYFSKKSNLST